MKAFGIFLVCFIIFDVQGSDASRIVGGDKAEKGDFPFAAAVCLKPEIYKFICTSSIISKKWLVTAAHCKVTSVRVGPFELYPRSHDYTVIVGEVLIGRTSPSYPVEKFYPHPEFSHENEYETGNDIALIRLKHPLVWSTYIAPIPLGTVLEEDRVSVLATGFGFQYPDDEATDEMSLNYVKMKTIGFEDCVDPYLEVALFLNQTLEFCAIQPPNQTPCKGDSGGPLIDFESGVLVGVVNGGLNCSGEYPAFFERVSHHIPWINEKTGLNF